MADSDLRSLQARLQQTLRTRVEAFSEEATEEEFVTLLGAVGALKRVAARLHELTVSPETARPDERRRLLAALHTLTDELAR